jgi:hypothetical protein
MLAAETNNNVVVDPHKTHLLDERSLQKCQQNKL